ncbi:MAG: hypothetical protein U9O55_01315, partial [Patescibacteria group bacterium]|nr:hypothetical protein [Patescibacteria group bacterium]
MTKMKFLGGHLFLILAFILLPNISEADIPVPYVNIFGIVKDSITNEPISSAEISFEPTWDPFDEWSSYFRYSSDDWITDENGKYSWHLHFPPNTTDIIA